MTLDLKPLFILPLIAAAPAAEAADMVVMPPPEISPINYMSVEGGPVWLKGDLDEVNPYYGEDKFGDVGDQHGFYAAATYRHMFNPTWDGQITATATWLGGTSGHSSIAGIGMDASSDLDFQTLDLDAGYHLNGNPLTRFLFGIRVLHSADEFNYSGIYEHYTYKADGWAFGPRVGFQSETMLGSSNIGFVAEASGSILFGSFDTDSVDEFGNSSSDSDGRTIYNIEGLAGLSWHATDRLAFTAGYRAQKWWNLREGANINDDGPYPNFGRYTLSGGKNPLIHGPFLRASIEF